MDDKLLLLGVLKQSEMHGYQLYDFIEQNLASCTTLKKPSAYFLLSKMEQEGLVQVAEQRVGNRPPRKVYCLTQAGERLFRQLLQENLSQFTPTVFPGDIGIAFLDQIPIEQGLRLLRKRLQKMQAYLTQLETIPPHPGSASLLIKHQIQHLHNEMQWLREVIAGLKEAGDLPQDQKDNEFSHQDSSKLDS
ncbi:MAG: helix-turn-helix transcriptional regulator [Anaerolineales bacterium]